MKIRTLSFLIPPPTYTANNLIRNLQNGTPHADAPFPGYLQFQLQSHSILDFEAIIETWVQKYLNLFNFTGI